MIETLPLEKANEAIQRLRDGDLVRYRLVLDCKHFEKENAEDNHGNANANAANERETEKMNSEGNLINLKSVG